MTKEHYTGLILSPNEDYAYSLFKCCLFISRLYGLIVLDFRYLHCICNNNKNIHLIARMSSSYAKTFFVPSVIWFENGIRPVNMRQMVTAEERMNRSG